MGLFSSVGKIFGGGGGSIAAGTGLAALDMYGAERANQTNEDIAHKNRQFQAYMSNTAHQREVKDLRAAGLNPILSAKYGGASTPSGSVATVSNSAVNASRNFKEIAMLASQIENIEADTDTKEKTLQHLDALITNTEAQTAKTEAETFPQLMMNDAMGKIVDKAPQIPVIKQLMDWLSPSANFVSDTVQKYQSARDRKIRRNQVRKSKTTKLGGVTRSESWSE